MAGYHGGLGKWSTCLQLSQMMKMMIVQLFKVMFASFYWSLAGRNFTIKEIFLADETALGCCSIPVAATMDV